MCFSALEVMVFYSALPMSAITGICEVLLLLLAGYTLVWGFAIDVFLSQVTISAGNPLLGSFSLAQIKSDIFQHFSEFGLVCGLSFFVCFFANW